MPATDQPAPEDASTSSRASATESAPPETATATRSPASIKPRWRIVERTRRTSGSMEVNTPWGGKGARWCQVEPAWPWRLLATKAVTGVREVLSPDTYRGEDGAGA